MANEKYDEIREQQQQTQLDTALSTMIGANSNQLGKLANNANKIIMQNQKKIAQRDAVSEPVTIDTSEIDKLVEDGEKLIVEIEHNNKNYNATNIYLDKMEKLGNKNKAEKKSLADSIDGILATAYTNNRRVEYQSPELEWVIKVRFFLVIAYYILFVIFLIRIGFISQSLYKNYRIVAMVVMGGALPLAITPVVLFCASLWHQITSFYDNSVPRNVYVNI
tara:strand:- start:4849 stop:5511 length:663 start_codon:yes stop_codon:yes gene_type:complete